MLLPSHEMSAGSAEIVIGVAISRVVMCTHMKLGGGSLGGEGCGGRREGGGPEAH